MRGVAGRRCFAAVVCILLCLTMSGCGQTDIRGEKSERTQKAIQAARRFDPAELRADTPEAIDAEFAARFADKRRAAEKLYREEDGKRILKHKFGETELPHVPVRIVCIRMEDPMLALDASMAAAYDFPQYYLHDRLAARGVMRISINDENKTINLEQVQAAKPDLIVMRDSFGKGVYQDLSKIAPVAAFDLRDYERTLLALSMVLQRPADGEARLQHFYERAKHDRMRIKARIGEATVALLRIMNKEVRLYPYATNDINRFMYELLNLRPPQMVVDIDGNDQNNAISLELLPELQTDYLLINAGYGPSSRQSSTIARRRFEAMQKDPLWQSVPAVRSGHMLEVDSMIWNAHGIISKETAMDALADWMEKHADDVQGESGL